MLKAVSYLIGLINIIQILSPLMIAEKPNNNYRISYSKCAKGKLHDNEALNLICLDKTCFQSPLICSICKTEAHSSHNVRPLKYYLEELKNKYTRSEPEILYKLQTIDRNRQQYLLAIQDAVTKVADRFKELEKSILTRFDLLRNQALLEETLRNQFSDLMEAVKANDQPEIEVLLKQYMPRVIASAPPAPARILETAANVQSILNKTIEHYYVAEIENIAFKELSITNLSKLNLLHNDLIKVNNTQIHHISNTVYSMALYNQKITPEDHKLKIKILTDNPKVTLGIMTLNEFNSCNFVFNPLKINNNSYWISHDNKKANSNYSCLTGYIKNDVVDLSYKKGQFVINKKKAKSYATFMVKDIGVDWYFFLAFENDTKVEIISKAPQKK